MPDHVAELYRLADLSTKIVVEEDGPFIHAMVYPAGSYNDPRMPLGRLTQDDPRFDRPMLPRPSSVPTVSRMPVSSPLMSGS